MKRKLKITIPVIFVLGITIYCFLFGKMFSYSPIIVGFTKDELSNTIAYVQNGAEFSEHQKIDSLIPSIEEFHQLKFKHKPKLFVFRNKESYLQRSMTKARFLAYPNGSLVISPWAIKEATEGVISLEIYLRHELSHILLCQNMGIMAAYIHYPKWLLEGIAVYSSDQMGTSWYPSKHKTYSYIQEGNFMPPEYFKTKQEDKIDLDVEYRITFMYSEFACIVDYLIHIYGREKFLLYMKRLIANNDHNKVFSKVYGIEFYKFIQNFKNSIMNKSNTSSQNKRFQGTSNRAAARPAAPEA